MQTIAICTCVIFIHICNKFDVPWIAEKYLFKYKKRFRSPFISMCLKVSLALPNMEAVGQICVLLNCVVHLSASSDLFLPLLPLRSQSWSTCSLWRTTPSRRLPSSTRCRRANAFMSSAIGSAFRKCTASATPSAAGTSPSLLRRCRPNRDSWWELYCITHSPSLSFSPSPRAFPSTDIQD